MKVRNFHTTFAALLLLVLAAAASAQTPSSQLSVLKSEQPKAVSVADAWLAVIDAGKTTEAWRALSAATTSKAQKTKWTSAIAETRQEFGQPKSRFLKGARLYLKGEGGQERDFYLVDYESVSLERGALRELLRVVRDDDGQWRVAGYQLTRKTLGGDENEEED